MFARLSTPALPARHGTGGHDPGGFVPPGYPAAPAGRGAVSQRALVVARPSCRSRKPRHDRQLGGVGGNPQPGKLHDPPRLLRCLATSTSAQRGWTRRALMASSGGKKLRRCSQEPGGASGSPRSPSCRPKRRAVSRSRSSCSGVRSKNRTTSPRLTGLWGRAKSATRLSYSGQLGFRDEALQPFWRHLDGSRLSTYLACPPPSLPRCRRPSRATGD